MQEPQTCYTPTVSATWDPAASDFLSHDPASENFQIQTTDQAHVGTYKVTVVATIPIYASLGSGQLVSDTFEFNVKIEDACETTALIFDPTVSSMLAYVSSAPITQQVLAIDTASMSYGNLDGFTFCGPRTYTIYPDSYSFLSLSGDTLTLVSTDPSEETASPLTISILASLSNYPDVLPVSQTFDVEIICKEDEFVKCIAPRFVEEAAKFHYKLLDDPHAPEVEPIYAVCL